MFSSRHDAVVGDELNAPPIRAGRFMLGDPNSIGKRIVKMIISGSYFCYVRAREIASSPADRRSGARMTVLCYHQVPDSLRPRFERQVDYLARKLKPAHANCAHAKWNCDAVLVTADDGWQSFYRNALPVLLRQRVPVVIFSVPGRLGGTIDGETDDRLMTAAELRAMPPTMVAIGSHSTSHRQLPTLDDHRARAELEGSRAQLEAILGRKVDEFCFPYGVFDEHSIELCRTCGYRRAYTSLPGPPRIFEDGFIVLGRTRVDPTDWPLEYRLKAHGAYAWISAWVDAKRRLSRRLGTLRTRLMPKPRSMPV